MSNPQDTADEPVQQQPGEGGTGQASEGESLFSAEAADAGEGRAEDTVAEGLEGGGDSAPNGAADAGAETETEDPGQLLERALSERQKAVDEALRARAEMDNVRKRAARDADNARKFALEKLMTDMLDVIESLERGLVAAEGEQASVEQLREGTELTSKMLNKVLAKHGLEEVVPEAEPFDPERHEALSMIPTEEFEPNTVVQVVQKGFVLNGRLLRPARVLVAQAPPQA